MPTYRYRCPKCRHEYDKFQKISDKTRAKCPECSARGERLITGGGGLLFKGSGFYATDYKKAGDKPPKRDDQEKKTDSKAAAKESKGKQGSGSERKTGADS